MTTSVESAGSGGDGAGRREGAAEPRGPLGRSARQTTWVRGVRTHNLKGIDVAIPHRALTVVSGVSGSGKSSLAFDTLYAEGQRRFVESLSTYARQFIRRMERPEVEAVVNIQPSIALRQKNTIKHARSTVGSLTEIVDLLQLIWTHIGVTRCPDCGEVVRRETPSDVADALMRRGEGRRLIFVADVKVLEVETPQQVLDGLIADGYRRLWIDGKAVEASDADVERLLEQSSFAVVVDRQKTGPGKALRLREAVEAGYRLGRGRLRVVDVTDRDAHETLAFDRAFRCNSCHRPFIEPVPALFSFNSPIGACPECSGFGKAAGLDMDKVVPNPGLSLKKGAVAVFQTSSQSKRKSRMMKAARARGIATDVPFGRLPQEDQDYILEGGKGYTGVRGYFDRIAKKKHKPYLRVLTARYRGYTTCPSCKGAKCSEEARCVTVAGVTIDRIWSLSVRDALEALEDWTLDEGDLAKVESLLEELRHRLHYLLDVGLGYLELDRPSRTLSGGEVQRIHLTSSLGRMLTNTLYVLDEPTAGLHPRDSLRLLSVLHRLRDIGNTVVVVEHDPEIIQGADWAIELGPSGGERGGELLFEGTREALERSETPTGAALRGRRVEIPEYSGGPWRFEPEFHPHISVLGATTHNLRGVDAHIPLGKMTCVTGVSGSGKSTLVHACLYQGWRRLRGEGGVEAGRFEALEGLDQVKELVLMRQGGLGRSSRSNIASYTKAWDGVRRLYGKTRQAGERGLKAGSFSFNTKGGRCERCEGTGTLTVEMHFMADLEIVCDACDGKRFTDKVLGVRLRGRNIDDVLKMTVAEALDFFKGSLAITRRLEPLLEVGLGYLRLGQTTATLSGGEAQRLVLASYLGQGRAKSKSGVLFIFDEPTVGLHLSDVQVLLKALRRAVNQGHTVLVVEHNSDFVAACDHVIDLGPGGGDEGGRVVATGPPSEVAACPESWTGYFMRELFA